MSVHRLNKSRVKDQHMLIGWVYLSMVIQIPRDIENHSIQNIQDIIRHIEHHYYQRRNLHSILLWSIIMMAIKEKHMQERYLKPIQKKRTLLLKQLHTHTILGRQTLVLDGIRQR